MRQVRVRRNTCRVAPHIQNLTRECAKESRLYNEDTEDYCNAWEQKTKLTENLPSCQMPEFRYSSARSLNSLAVSANMDDYGGGGYVFRIKGSNKKNREGLLKLQQQHWINNQTRAVLLEFSIYNVNVNLFAVGTVIAEFIPGGGIHSYCR